MWLGTEFILENSVSTEKKATSLRLEPSSLPIKKGDFAYGQGESEIHNLGAINMFSPSELAY